MVDLISLLRQSLQDPLAEFHYGQEEAIKAALEPPYRTLVVQATGWGKSIVYFIATRVMRDQGKGPTIVISPLLSLMRDQIKAAKRLNLHAAQYTSSNPDDWPIIEEKLKTNSIDLLLISPERLANEEFSNLVSSSTLAKAGLIVIDEAHCISDWGHDFRPDYQRIGNFIRKLPPSTAVIATTATANDRVIQDIQQQLGEGIKILRGPLTRTSLKLQVIVGLDTSQRLAWLSDHLTKLPGSGIIYALTVRDTERIAAWLQSEKHDVAAYHAGIDASLKTELEDKLLNNEVKALVATIALGMGFDKPDLGFVVHYQSPGNLVAYYQQIGRAGRAIPDALAILFMGTEDERINECFITNARPSEENIMAVLRTLEEAQNGLRLSGIAQRLNLKEKGEIEKVLKTLSVSSPSPISKSNNIFTRTPVPYTYNSVRETELINRRKQERASFVAFAETEDCLMMRVAKELDDQTAIPCGKCVNCLGEEIVSSEISDTTLKRAMGFLKRREFDITPRKRWSVDAFPQYGFTGNINVSLLCSDGICLSNWGDSGIASWVETDKKNNHFRDALVEVSVDAIQRKTVESPPSWVCAVPSLRSGNLVPDFAERLAGALGLEYVNAIEKMNMTDPQKAQQNSYHQAGNLDGAFNIREVRSGTVLLVDDMVDSGWTFTVIGALLRKGGSGPVIPLALCSTKGSDND